MDKIKWLPEENGIAGGFEAAGFLTLLGYLISDILYALVDPRISYT